jgi:hypothetical protein
MSMTAFGGKNIENRDVWDQFLRVYRTETGICLQNSVLWKQVFFKKNSIWDFRELDFSCEYSDSNFINSAKRKFPRFLDLKNGSLFLWVLGRQWISLHISNYGIFLNWLQRDFPYLSFLIIVASMTVVARKTSEKLVNFMEQYFSFQKDYKRKQTFCLAFSKKFSVDKKFFFLFYDFMDIFERQHFWMRISWEQQDFRTF